jgi:hypothetical protein
MGCALRRWAQRVVAGAASAAVVAAACLYSARSAAAEAEAKERAAAAADPYANPERPQYRLYTMASIPGWSLPTYHPASLKVQAYMRFLKPGQAWFETDASSA